MTGIEGGAGVRDRRHLHVSLSTAKTHVGRLLMKLGAPDRAQLVIAAYETGLVRPAHGADPPGTVQAVEGGT
ncbi:hypothetical protein AB0D63_31620 [Kitasatospora sp. NPDC048343]|uniref:response regulator transcription factor n=1 Tax=Kitasatospora sp. NPDC048343 TaxID=3154717 RepID=UPI0033CF80AE